MYVRRGVTRARAGVSPREIVISWSTMKSDVTVERPPRSPPPSASPSATSVAIAVAAAAVMLMPPCRELYETLEFIGDKCSINNEDRATCFATFMRRGDGTYSLCLYDDSEEGGRYNQTTTHRTTRGATRVRLNSSARRRRPGRRRRAAAAAERAAAAAVGLTVAAAASTDSVLDAARRRQAGRHRLFWPPRVPIAHLHRPLAASWAPRRRVSAAARIPVPQRVVRGTC